MQTPPRLQVELLAEPFAPLHRLEQWQQQQRHTDNGSAAAEALFIGRVRPQASDGAALTALELEHYPGMTERQLEQLATTCGLRHGIEGCLILHRIGRVLPGDAIVLVAVAADRRGPAQRCCQELLEALKHEAPFWKREWRADGSGHWITGNTPW
jgi:molybdopterin synthase catalytic subunit